MHGRHVPVLHVLPEQRLLPEGTWTLTRPSRADCPDPSRPASQMKDITTDRTGKYRTKGGPPPPEEMAR